MNSLELKEFREKHGLTQSQLAELVGVKVGTVSKWEQGSRSIGQSVIKLLHQYEAYKLEELPEKQKTSDSEARFEDIVARRVIEIITPILEKLGENQKSALGSVDDFKVTMQHLLLDLDELKDEIEEVKDLVKQSDRKLDKLV
jgi:transcriptional regulator with XRE-family HTH domain